MTSTFGKLRQWTGLGGVARTVDLDPATQDLEREIDYRRLGTERIYTATEAYVSSLSKLKALPFPLPYDFVPPPESSLHPERHLKVDGASGAFSDSGKASEGSKERENWRETKVLPIEALGIAMAAFGGDFGDDSAYGQCLLSLSTAHLSIASLQTSFTSTLSSIFLDRLASAKASMAEYQAARRKLESKRAALESARARKDKLEAGKKGMSISGRGGKEKERREVEDEVRNAKAAFDEASAEVEYRISVIQESELDDLRSLTSFLDTHLSFAESYAQILRDCRSNWIDEASIQLRDSPAETASASVGGSGAKRNVITRSGRSLSSPVLARKASTPTLTSRQPSLRERRASSTRPPLPPRRLSGAAAMDEKDDGRGEKGEDKAFDVGLERRGSRASQQQQQQTTDKQQRPRKLRGISVSGAGEAMASLARDVTTFRPKLPSFSTSSAGLSSVTAAAASSSSSAIDTGTSEKAGWGFIARSKGGPSSSSYQAMTGDEDKYEDEEGNWDRPDSPNSFVRALDSMNLEGAEMSSRPVSPVSATATGAHRNGVPPMTIMTALSHAQPQEWGFQPTLLSPLYTGDSLAGAGTSVSGPGQQQPFPLRAQETGSSSVVSDPFAGSVNPLGSPGTVILSSPTFGHSVEPSGDDAYGDADGDGEGDETRAILEDNRTSGGSFDGSSLSSSERRSSPYSKAPATSAATLTSATTSTLKPATPETAGATPAASTPTTRARARSTASSRGPAPPPPPLPSAGSRAKAPPPPPPRVP